LLKDFQVTRETGLREKEFATVVILTKRPSSVIGFSKLHCGPDSEPQKRFAQGFDLAFLMRTVAQ